MVLQRWYPIRDIRRFDRLSDRFWRGFGVGPAVASRSLPLDVVEEEPLPGDSELWDLPNVILTPHAAARSQNRIGRLVELFCENLARYVAGEPLLNVVRKDLGF